MGLSYDVHQDIEILPMDNGERFLSEYLIDNEHRKQNESIIYEANGRCNCILCAGAPSESTGKNSITVPRTADQKQKVVSSAAARRKAAASRKQLEILPAPQMPSLPFALNHIFSTPFALKLPVQSSSFLTPFASTPSPFASIPANGFPYLPTPFASMPFASTYASATPYPSTPSSITASYCCNPYRNYIQTRDIRISNRGRIPHSKECREKQKEQNQI